MSYSDVMKVQIKEQLANLDEGASSLLAVRPIGGGKVELEFAQVINNPNSGSDNVLAEFNRSDERFSGSGAVREWLNAEPADVKRLLPDVYSKVQQAIEKGERVFIGIDSPTMPSGNKLVIQVTEDHKPEDDWDVENLQKSAKSDGQGNFMLKGGKLIFRHTKLVSGTPQHTFVQHDDTTTDPHGAMYDVEEGSNSSITEDDEADKKPEVVEK